MNLRDHGEHKMDLRVPLFISQVTIILPLQAVSVELVTVVESGNIIIIPVQQGSGVAYFKVTFVYSPA
jgi:hypothetical protein